MTHGPAARAPEISVVIPTRDRGRRLVRTLSCALGQSGVDLEVIVVDDGSTDETADRLAEIGDPRLRVLRHATPRGVASARNAGIAAARAPWVAFLDDDDLWSPDKLRLQLACGRETGAGAVYCGAIMAGEDGAFLWAIPMPRPDELWVELHRRNPLPSGPSNVIVRTGVIRALGGFDGEFSFMADWDMWLMLASFIEFAAVPDPLVAYVDHKGSMTRSGPRTAGPEYRKLVRKHRTPNGPRFDSAQVLRYRAGLHRGGDRWLRASVLYVRSGARGRPADIVRGLALLFVGPVVARLRSHGVERPQWTRWRARVVASQPPPWLDALNDTPG